VRLLVIADDTVACLLCKLDRIRRSLLRRVILVMGPRSRVRLHSLTYPFICITINDTLYHAESVYKGCYIAISGTVRQCQAACAAGGWAFIVEQRLRHVYRRTGTAVALNMQVNVSCSWGYGRPGIGWLSIL